MPLVVVTPPKVDKSRELFNKHELLGLAIRVQFRKTLVPLGSVTATRGMGMRSRIAPHQNVLLIT
nr:unnamed protein product [Callosobruchus chinensis]